MPHVKAMPARNWEDELRRVKAEMLEALERLRLSILDDHRMMTDRQHDAIVQAEAAIARAKGE